MNITENLTRIKSAKTDIINSLKNKGVEIPDNTLINEIPIIIDNAEIGGGGDTPSVPELTPKYEGATVFRINVPEDNYEFAINLCNDATKATYDVDWGDGSLEYGKTTDEQHHIYSKAGTYDVNVYNLSKDITLGGWDTSVTDTSNFMPHYLFNNTNNDYWSGDYIYQKDNTVINVLIGDKITSIGEYAFSSCTYLQSIIIPNSVTSIGRYVFQNCSSLTSITIPDSVNFIGSNAFDSCISLKSVTILGSNVSLGNYIVKDCYSLQSLNLPISVTSIGNYMFNNCYMLQKIVLPKGVKTLGYSFFSTCLALQSVVIPDSVTKIGGSSFITCGKLQNIVIPNSVTSIENAFNSCNSLQSIILESLTAPTIQSGSFPTSGFKYTKRYLYVPKDSVGYNEENWKTNLIDKGWELRYIEDYPKTPTTLKLKTKNNFFHNLQAIGQANLVDYELIDNEYIYHFDDKITELLSNTFYKKVLEEIELPEGLEIMGTECFRDFISLQSVVIPNSVTSIGNNAFSYSNNLRLITCLNPTAPTITSSSFSSIGSAVPSGTPKILRIPQGASGYEETTSEWYKQLIARGWTVEYIVPNTLNYTSYSGDVVTPYIQSFEGKNEIVSNVYENGKGTITFKEGLTEIYEGMYNKDVVSALTSIEIPNGVTKIGDYSFRSQNLTTLNLPNSVTSIGNSAFNGCTNLTEITLGNSVETIGQWAFSSCGKIATITCMAMVAPTLNQSFLGVGSNVSGDKILRVPEGAEGYDTWLSQLNGFTIEYI